MAKLNFQQPLLPPSVALDPSEIILICLIIINVENRDTYFRIILCLKKQHLFETEMYINE